MAVYKGRISYQVTERFVVEANSLEEAEKMLHQDYGSGANIESIEHALAFWATIEDIGTHDAYNTQENRAWLIGARIFVEDFRSCNGSWYSGVLAKTESGRKIIFYEVRLKAEE